MADTYVVMRSCQADECTGCPEWIPDPWSADSEEPSRVVCVCGCHQAQEVAAAVLLWSSLEVIPF